MCHQETLQSSSLRSPIIQSTALRIWNLFETIESSMPKDTVRLSQALDLQMGTNIWLQDMKLWL